MPPKPFPFPLNVGIDICHVPRIRKLILKDHGHYLIPWVTRIFNTIEYGDVRRRLHAYKIQAFQVSNGHGTLPPRSTDTQGKPNPDQSPEDSFAQWIAGRLTLSSYISQIAIRFICLLRPFLLLRFAAKEAAIKAHTSRRLYYRDISILSTQLEGFESSGLQTKPVVLVDPPRAIVRISNDIAQKRGLLVARSATTQGGESPLDAEGFVTRNIRIREDERRTAQISISHENQYAVAVCMAVDDVWPEPTEVIDDGSGDPIHEPKRGDEGFQDFSSTPL